MLYLNAKIAVNVVFVIKLLQKTIMPLNVLGGFIYTATNSFIVTLNLFVLTV